MCSFLNSVQVSHFTFVKIMSLLLCFFTDEVSLIPGFRSPPYAGKIHITNKYIFYYCVFFFVRNPSTRDDVPEPCFLTIRNILMTEGVIKYNNRNFTLNENLILMKTRIL